jgi:hypothetical protein
MVSLPILIHQLLLMVAQVLPLELQIQELVELRVQAVI